MSERRRRLDDGQGGSVFEFLQYAANPPQIPTDPSVRSLIWSSPATTNLEELLKELRAKGYETVLLFAESPDGRRIVKETFYLFQRKAARRFIRKRQNRGWRVAATVMLRDGGAA